jgi:predicted CopG family antitoxin
MNFQFDFVLHFERNKYKYKYKYVLNDGKMASKMIAIKEDIYVILSKLKFPNESFSDVILRLITNQKKDPLQHFGNALSLPENENQEFEESIINVRIDQKERQSKRFQNLWEN